MFVCRSICNLSVYDDLQTTEREGTEGGFTGRSARRAALIMLLGNAMISKITVRIAVGLALSAATVRLPATTCILTNTSSPKACQPGCCANKACCARSHERTGPPVQPLAKSSSDQPTFAAIPAITAIGFVRRDFTKSRDVSIENFTSHAPALLALICIRLI
jgi:hypothetical protein